MWLTLPWKGIISLMIKEAVANTNDGGGQWWREGISMFLKNRHKYRREAI